VPTVDPKDVVIIGGGFAGLSAGVALAARGFRVALLERKPALGGRAYSFVDPETGDSVDNGQHVLMGCYAETLSFLDQIGTRDKLVFHQNLEIQMLAQGGARARLYTAHVPGPLHMGAALLRYGHLSPAQRLRLMVAGGQLLRMRRHDRARLESLTVAQLMDVLHQGETARQSFWYPMAIATLNEDPALASAALLAEVLKRGFFSRRSDSAFVYSRVGLSELYCHAATAFIERNAGVVAPHTNIQEFDLNGDGAVKSVILRDGRKLEAANFIAAVPSPQLLAMLPAAVAADPFFARLTELGTSPIICVHVWLDREVTDFAFVGFIGRATQWLFNKRKIFAQHGERHPGYLSFVISGARALIDRSNEELLDLVMEDLRVMIPAARRAQVVKAIVLKEKHATMAPAPRSHQLRPPAVTPLRNLFLAGDWIQTGLPATIESAVISGRAAAAAIVARVGGSSAAAA
jgi:squalene-associated FAD-dependent desaturase